MFLVERMRAQFSVRLGKSSKFHLMLPQCRNLAELVRQLKELDGETWVVMEHTRRYCESVANQLYEASLYVSEANPHLIKEYCGNSLRRVKTDETDAIKLRGMLLTTGTDLRDYTHMDTIRCLLQN
ncbi:MAG: IS110 family transposase [Oscillospiraceae bacterium]|jgi:transposase